MTDSELLLLDEELEAEKHRKPPEEALALSTTDLAAALVMDDFFTLMVMSLATTNATGNAGSV